MKGGDVGPAVAIEGVGANGIGVELLFVVWNSPKSSSESS